jgi:type I restriction enzyme S subunit
VGYPAISPSDLGRIPTPVPLVQEQQAIADFLDRETARIDGLIRAKELLLELLKDRWRTEVIGVVTHGLFNDESIPVDSPWFTRLPADWKLEPLKRRWTVVDCKHVTPVYADAGYPLVSHAEIDGGHVYPGRSGRLVEESDFLNLIEGRRPKQGDIIYTRNAAIGNAGYVDTVEDFAMGQDVCLITSEDQDQRFLTYFLNYVAVEQLAAQRLGATFGRINVAQIVDLQIMCPPPEAQRTIANHLDARRETYETGAAQLGCQIELLAEHRQALITAAVTGQIDVSGQAP